MSDECVFCAIVAGDGPAEIVDSDEHTVAFMDIAPATRGHALVIPREHHADLREIPEQVLAQTVAAAQRLTAKLDRALLPEGFNLINACGAAAWQTVFHFHLHVIPRWHDDPLELPWVPKPGDADEIAGVAAEIRERG